MRRSLFAAALLATLIGGPLQAAGVDHKRLLNADSEAGQWFTVGRGYDEQRYSPLKEIDLSNVSRLGVAWSAEIPLAAGNETHQENTPLVFNGVFYGITPWSITYAIDLKTHKEVWRSDPEVNQGVWRSRICCGVFQSGRTAS